MTRLRRLHRVHGKAARFSGRAREGFNIQTHEIDLLYGFGAQITQSLSQLSGPQGELRPLIQLAPSFPRGGRGNVE
jgi:hypothetical protein